MKLPFSFSLKFAFRLLLPGFIFTLGVFPIIHTILKPLDLTINSEFAFFLSIVIFGWMFVIFDMPIYMAFEGRRYWPEKLWNLSKKCEENRLQKLNNQRRRPRNSAFAKLKYLEVSVELRRFPIGDDGEYCAKFPTRIGNLIAAYESYPKQRYGMDSVFYWYRIWLKLSTEMREEIDNQQALADSTIYTVAALNICGVFCVLYTILKAIIDIPINIPINIQFISQLISVLPNVCLLLVLAILAFAASYTIYRFSLHIHATFGETYKSVFDNYKDEFSIEDVIEEVSNITREKGMDKQPKREQYEIAWRYLHNYRIKQNGKVLRPSEIPPQSNP